MARVRSAKRIKGRVTRGAQTSVYSALADSSAGRDKITSPMAPGRIRRRRMGLLDKDIEMVGGLPSRRDCDINGTFPGQRREQLYIVLI